MSLCSKLYQGRDIFVTLPARSFLKSQEPWARSCYWVSGAQECTPSLWPLYSEPTWWVNSVWVLRPCEDRWYPSVHGIICQWQNPKPLHCKRAHQWRPPQNLGNLKQNNSFNHLPIFEKPKRRKPFPLSLDRFLQEGEPELKSKLRN